MKPYSTGNVEKKVRFKKKSDLWVIIKRCHTRRHQRGVWRVEFSKLCGKYNNIQTKLEIIAFLRDETGVILMLMTI